MIVIYTISYKWEVLERRRGLKNGELSDEVNEQKENGELRKGKRKNF